MAEFNFPSSPSEGTTYVVNDVTYTYNATKGYWVVSNYANSPIGYTGSRGVIGYTGSNGGITTGKAIAMAIVFG